MPERMPGNEEQEWVPRQVPGTEIGNLDSVRETDGIQTRPQEQRATAREGKIVRHIFYR